MACEPRDVLWSAIAIRGRERLIREAIIWTITVVICLTWFAPVGAISTLMSIPTIKKINPELGARMENIPAVKTIFGTFIPPLVLNIFTSVLPLLFDGKLLVCAAHCKSVSTNKSLPQLWATIKACDLEVQLPNQH